MSHLYKTAEPISGCCNTQASKETYFLTVFIIAIFLPRMHKTTAINVLVHDCCPSSLQAYSDVAAVISIMIWIYSNNIDGII
jgi:hypothetical protein